MGRGQTDTHTDTHTHTHTLTHSCCFQLLSKHQVLWSLQEQGLQGLACLLSEVPTAFWERGEEGGRGSPFSPSELQTSVVKRQPWYLPWAPTSCLLTTVITPTVFCGLSKAAQPVCMCVYVFVHVPRCTYVHVSLASISRAWPSKSTSLCGCDHVW